MNCSKKHQDNLWNPAHFESVMLKCVGNMGLKHCDLLDLKHGLLFPLLQEIPKS